MVAVWQRERADGIWIWNARWGLEACAHHFHTHYHCFNVDREGANFCYESCTAAAAAAAATIFSVAAARCMHLFPPNTGFI
jgi:hypothetical protein